MPTLLSDLIDAIPVAGRGDVISPESHNSLRDAIVAIVTELGGAVVTLTFAPTFLEASDPLTGGQLPKWAINIGLAQSFGGNPAVTGWLPLQLPDGSQIQQLRVVFGGTKPLNSQMDVTLQRQDIAGEISALNLATLSVSSIDRGVIERKAPFSLDPGVRLPAGVPPPDIVNNDKYKYFVRAHLSELPRGGEPPVTVTIFAIRVDCSLLG
jgi:hypothetical protein